MKEIEQAYLYAVSKRKKFVIILFACAICIAILALLEKIKESDMFSIVVISCITIFLILLGILVINSPNIKGSFRSSRVYKSLENLGYADEFINTIDYEIQNQLRINYHDDVYHIGLFVTKTWLVFISSNGSAIRKVSEISNIYKEFSPTRSKHFIRIDFTDGSSFANMCDSACDEIIELIKKEFPSITSRTK